MRPLQTLRPDVMECYKNDKSVERRKADKTGTSGVTLRYFALIVSGIPDLCRYHDPFFNTEGFRLHNAWPFPAEARLRPL